jgi:hypothetical protein
MSNRGNMRFADRILGGVMGILGLCCFVEAYRIWNGWDGTGIMPLIVGVISIFLSAKFLLFPSHETASIKWPNKKEMLNIGMIGGSFAFYISIMNWVGYPISTWFFLAVVARFISPNRTFIILLWTGAVAVGSYILFKRFLDMYLPVGFIGV